MIRCIKLWTGADQESCAGIMSSTLGRVDAISFPGLGGLFIAHVTGNLVIHAAHLVRGGGAPVAPTPYAPVFAIPATSTRAAAWITSKTVPPLSLPYHHELLAKLHGLTPRLDLRAPYATARRSVGIQKWRRSPSALCQGRMSGFSSLMIPQRYQRAPGQILAPRRLRLYLQVSRRYQVHCSQGARS
jgi:hypothetical protein